jgi:hypothetical protein
VLLTLNCIQRNEKCRLDNAKEELESLKYHPLRKHKPVGGGGNEHKVKRKKLKSCNDCESDDNFSICLKSQNYLLPNRLYLYDNLWFHPSDCFLNFSLKIVPFMSSVIFVDDCSVLSNSCYSDI